MSCEYRLSITKYIERRMRGASIKWDIALSKAIVK